MNNAFSIYDSPFSEETKKLRRNLLFASSVCIFIGLTNHLPSSFGLWGAKFDTQQQTVISWLLLSLTLYHFLHFFASASIELAKWIQPFYEGLVAKKRALKHPDYDETDWEELLREDDPDPEGIVAFAKIHAQIHVEKRLRYLYNFIYLKLFIEILLPIAIGIFGLINIASEINDAAKNCL
jgi:hypothetical protein